GDVHDLGAFLQVDLLLDLVRDLADALNDVPDRIGPLYGISRSLFGQKGGLELYEILGVFLQVSQQILPAVPPGKTVRVLPWGDTADPHVHALFQNQVYSPKGIPKPGRIPVKEHGDVLGEPVDQADLVWG